MEWLALIFSILAVVLSIWTFRRMGGLTEIKTRMDALSSLGLTEMKKQGDSLSSLGESVRGKAADALDHLGKKVRGAEKPEEEIKGEESVKKEEGKR
jgi:hypothetical protein